MACYKQYNSSAKSFCQLFCKRGCQGRALVVGESRFPLKSLSPEELTYHLLSAVAVTERLKAQSMEMTDAALAIVLSDLALSLRALYTTRLSVLCPDLPQPSMTLLASFFMVSHHLRGCALLRRCSVLHMVQAILMCTSGRMSQALPCTCGRMQHSVHPRLLSPWNSCLSS